jgi:hypothetical protein
MNMRLLAALIIVTCAGCGEGKSPVQSTPVPPTPVAPTPVPPGSFQFSLYGLVFDMADRPLAYVRIDVVDGPGAGTFATTDDSGRYEFPGTFSGFSSDTMTIKATKDGYAPSLMRYQPKISGREALSAFMLDLSTPSVNITGDYTITFTVDPSCSGFPDAIRTRTYAVAMTPMPGNSNRYQALLGGATSFPFASHDRFGVGVVGTFAHFDFGYPWGYGDYTSIIEQVAPPIGGYVYIDGSADLSVGGLTISGSFQGDFSYCPTTGGTLFNCPIKSVGCYTTIQVLLVRR